MSESIDLFQNKLYAILPFKSTQSPPSSPTVNPQNTQTLSIIDQKFTLFKIPEPSLFLDEIVSIRQTSSDQPVFSDPPNVDTNKKTFTSISSTIDILFSKIEKIKEQFSFALTRHHSQSQLGYERAVFPNEIHSEKRLQVNFDNNKENQYDFEPDKTKANSNEEEKRIKSQPKGVLLQSVHNEQKFISQLSNHQQQDTKQKQIKPQPLSLFSNWAQSEPKTLGIRDFELGKCIGSGKFGDVYISMHKATGFFCAIKKVFKSTIKQYQMQDQFTNQLRIHYSLNHTNIVKIYSHFQDQYHIFLLLQLAPQNSLIQRLPVSQRQTARSIGQITDALIYLHQNNIIHRDIKPENIVLIFDVPKLCDFGWATFRDNVMHETFCGTLDYVSPEMKDLGQYNESVDIWSLGVLTFQLLAGFPPFKQQITNWKLLGSKRRVKWSWDVIFPPSIEDQARSFIQRILKTEPLQRIALPQCKFSKFLLQNSQEHVPSEMQIQLSSLFQC